MIYSGADIPTGGGKLRHRLFRQTARRSLVALQLRQPVSLAGLSMGGPITATFTARHPDSTDKLILIDPGRCALAPAYVAAQDRFTALRRGSTPGTVREGQYG